MNVSASDDLSTLSATPACQDCAAGTISLGGGYSVSGELSEWEHDKWPSGMEAWCIGRRGNHWVLNANGCDNWRPELNGTIITSGNNKGKHDIMSALRLVVVLKKKGYVSFRYQVEAQHNSDGLEFTINSVIRMGFRANQPTWKERRFELQPGSHVLQWMYWKDNTGDFGKDQASLEIIEISGTEYAEFECAKCPGGTKSIEGSSACVSCGDDEYASEAHYGQCLPCPPDTYSFAGAVGMGSCLPRPDCEEVDYSKNYTDCDLASNTRTMFFNWTLPHICNETNGVSLPPRRENQACEPCQPGEYSDRTSPTGCTPCNAGHYLPTGVANPTCTQCPQGQESVEEVYYEYWYKWPQGYTNLAGWVLHEDYAYAGGLSNVNGQRKGAAQLELRTYFRQSGAVKFTYQALDVQGFDPQVDSFGFFIDGVPQKEMTAAEGSYEITIENVEPGHHTLLWNVKGRNLIRLHRVIVIGVDGGGATSCADCPPGTESSPDRSSCIACQPGHVSHTGDFCEPCPENTYAATPASCLPCGAGTQSGKGASHCAPEKMLEGTRSYQLEALLNSFRNPGPKHTNTSKGVEIKIGEETYAFSLRPTVGGGALLSEKRLMNPSSAYAQVPAKSEYGGQNCSIIPEYDYISAGSELSISEITQFEPSTNPNPSRGGGLEFAISSGSAEAGCSSGLIKMICDLDVTDMFSSVQKLNSSTPSANSTCQSLDFEMASMYACPLCTTEDWGQANGDCKAGKQKVTWYKTRACIADSRSSFTKNCSLGYSPLVIGLLCASVVLAVGLAAGLAYYLYRLRKRYNDVHSKYVILRDGYDKNSFSMVPNGTDNLMPDDEEEAEMGIGEGKQRHDDDAKFTIEDDDDLKEDDILGEEPEV